MNEEKIRQLIQEEIASQSNTNQYTVSNTTFHVHNGLDSSRVSAKNLIWNDKLLTGFIANDVGGGGPVFLEFGIFNPSSIILVGVARNPATGTAVQKATIVGHAELGNCFKQTDQDSLDQSNTNIIQGCSTNYFDNASGAWIPTVNVSDAAIATVDSTDNTICSAIITSMTNSSIRIDTVVSAGWLLTCNLFIS